MGHRATQRSPIPAMMPLARGSLAYVVAILLCAWPLPPAMTHALPDPVAMGFGGWARADLDLLVWILAAGAHGLATDPAHVFDANIFHPARHTLALSEHLLGLAPVSMPVFLATGNAVLTYNVTVLAVVLVAAIGTFALLREWGADDLSAWIAGAAFALSPLVMGEWIRLHVSALHLFPWILLLGWRAAAAPSRRALAWLATATALQTLAGVYVTFELAVLLAGATPVLWWRARRHGYSGLPILAALAIGALPLAPILLVYRQLQATGTLPAGVNPAIALFAHLLRPSALAEQLREALGWPMIVLGAVGLVRRSAPAPAHLRVGLAGIAALGFAFALGPTPIGPYRLAAWALPGFGGMRTPTRFLVVPLLAIACAAGLGIADVRRLLAARIGPRLTRLVALAACVVVVAAHRPAGGVPLVDEVPSASTRAVHEWLAAHGDGKPVVVVPPFVFAMDMRSLLLTTESMVASARHFQPLVNGYSGYTPQGTQLLMTLAQRLPERRAFEDLCRLVGPGWLVVRETAAPPGWIAQSQRLPIAVAMREGDDVLLRVSCSEPPTLLPALRRQMAAADEGTTLLGLDRRTLAPEARRGAVRAVRIPERFAAGLMTRLWVDVEHEGRDPWPGLSVWSPGTVGLQARWRDVETGAVHTRGMTTSLARDLAPGEAMRAQVEAPIPAPGVYDLEIGLVRIEGPVDGAWFADEPAGSGMLRRRVETVAVTRPGSSRREGP